MKKVLLHTILFTIVLLAVVQLLSAQSMVAYYPFNGNANDASGNGNNGTPAGATLATDRFNLPNSCYSFAGGTDVISVPDHPTLNVTTHFSGAAWVYATATPPSTGSSNLFSVISKNEGSGIDSPKWIFGLQNGGLAFHNNGLGMGLGHWAYSNTFTLTLNTWYHIAFSKSGNSITFYLNGNNLGTFSIPVPSNFPAAPLRIGFSEPSVVMNGRIDEVRLYNYTLSASQISDIFKQSSLVLSLPFNGNANDASGFGNHGTVNGATLTSDRFGNANSAYYFHEPSQQYINVPDNPLFDFGNNDFTVRAWVNADQLNTGKRIIGAGYEVNNGLWSLGIGTNSFWGSNIRMNTVFYSGTTVDVNTPQQLNTVINKWYQVCMVRTAGTIRFYINGKFIGANSLSGSILANPVSDLLIGARCRYNPTDRIEFFWGKLDDIEIFNIGLSDAIIFDDYVNDLKRPGSGNTLSFEPGRYVELPDDESWNFANNDFAIEAWINPQNIASFSTLLTQSVGGAAGTVSSFYLGLNYNGSGSLSFFTTTSTGWTHSIASPPGSIEANKWQHIVVTRQGGLPYIFINGISQTLSNNAGGSATPNFGIAPTIFNGTRVVEIAIQNGALGFTGQMDELRVFNGSGLTQTQVRDWMCRKMTSSHPVYANLVAYSRFDEGNGNLTSGYNGNYGTLMSSPTWQTSGAALGDDATHDFVNPVKTATLSALTGENFTVTSTSGSPAGILVYRVDEAPNTTAGANSGTNDRYFGVFQSGGSSPQYTAVYNYTGNPLVTGGNEPLLRLAKRADNSVTAWTQMPALPNEPANTITLTGESTEYILGQLGSPLPVTLLSFAASRCGNNVCLLWTVENEVNFSHYEVEKSTSLSNFTVIANTTARGSSARSNYTSTDLNPASGDNFYRLKMVNLDGSYNYSKIIRVNFTKTVMASLQPNPASGFVILKELESYQQYRIVDAAGKIYLQQNIQAPVQEIDISRLSNGLYFIQLINNNQVTTLKLVKQ